MNYQDWQHFVKEHGDETLIDGKTKVRDWPMCPTPDCGYGVCMWADTGLCYPCSKAEVGVEEMDRRYAVTH